MDDELLQDFLVEAGEILEQLNEQLVDLEQSPEDVDLLNAVFRGFHTIKGGAGFLNIEPMVSLCHRAEDVFNLLRNGERKIDTGLMDTILPVLDVLNEQFEQLRSGETPAEVDANMLLAIERYAVPAGAEEPPAVAAAAEPEAPTSTAESAVASDDEITDEEFEQLLDAVASEKAQNAPVTATPTAPTDSDDISEDEFEAMLDDLHGKGKFSSQPKAAAAAQPETTIDDGVQKQSPADDEISDAEFEALLDELHGRGKFSAPAPTDAQVSASPTSGSASESTAAPSQPAATVAQKPAAQKKDSVVDSGAANATKNKPAAASGSKAAPQAEATVRVDTRRLDEIMNMVGELVLVRNRIERLGASLGDEEMQKAVANLDLVTSDLQTSVMKTRMQPIKKVFGRFPRVVRDIARSLNKEIRLEMLGEDTDLDKNLVEALADPLVHLVRNAVDHGIEMPEERVKAGKSREGTVILTAAQEGDHILLTIEDDGGGMDPDKLRKIAVDKGLMDTDSAARLDDRECYALIFAPGFSTKAEISDISGRGVGMDVVKTRIAQLNGSVDIDSSLGKGTRLSIKLPLTLAIMPTLMVQLEEQLFALPLVNVNEIFHLDLTKTNVVDGQLCVVVRERTLPLFYLSRWLVKGQHNAELPKEGHVVVVHVGSQRVGFVVDALIGQEEVVIKPLGALLQGTGGLAGATITGDGGIAIILDVPGLLSMYARQAA